MTILEAIKDASIAAGIEPGALAFAQLQEFNSFLDSFKFKDYPVNVVLPVELNGTVKVPMRCKETLLIRGWMLTRIRKDTSNYRSVDIEPTYINPMRTMARKFLGALLDTDIVDPETSDVPYSIKSEYMFLSAHLFGVSYSINLPVYTRIC